MENQLTSEDFEEVEVVEEPNNPEGAVGFKISESRPMSLQNQPNSMEDVVRSDMENPMWSEETLLDKMA